MNEEKIITRIPYVVHESEAARLERTIKRMFILCIVLIGVLVASNLYWILR